MTIVGAMMLSSPWAVAPSCAHLRRLAFGSPKTILEVTLALNQAVGGPLTDQEVAALSFERQFLVWEVATANDQGEGLNSHRQSNGGSKGDAPGDDRVVSQPSTVVVNPVKQLVEAFAGALQGRDVIPPRGAGGSKRWISATLEQAVFNALLDALGDHLAPGAVILNPVASPTTYNPILISGQAEVGTTIRIEGGATPAAGAIDSNGAFGVLVTLTPNSSNSLVAFAEDPAGNAGPSSSLLVIHDDIHPEGFTYPDPFRRCENVTLHLRSPDLSGPGVASTVTLALPEAQLLRAPPTLTIRSTLPETAAGRAAHLAYGANACDYSYAVAQQAFILSGCAQMEGTRPAQASATSVTMTVNGIDAMRSFTVQAQLEAAPPCRGRPLLSAAKFFDRSDRDGIPGQWLVVLDERSVAPGDVTTVAQQLAGLGGGTVRATFSAGPLGFAMSAAVDGARLVAAHGSVRFVESDVAFRGHGISAALPSAEWALDRMDQVPSQPSAQDMRFRWPETNLRVDQRPAVFVIDTQVRISHGVFSGFTRTQRPILRSQCAFGTGSNSEHGTASASMVVGRLGTSQQLTRELIIEPALGSGGVPLSCDFAQGPEIISALQDVQARSLAGDVVNMSFGGTALSGMIEMDINALIDNGRIVVASAGNEAARVNYPPANVPGVLTVGGTQQDDGEYSLTNFGPEVDLYAPASNVHIALDTTDSAEGQRDGTSLASPLVAGLAFHATLQSTASTSRAYVNDIISELRLGAISLPRASGRTDALPFLHGRALELGSLGFTSVGGLGDAAASGFGLFIGLRSQTAADSSLVRVPLDIAGVPLPGEAPQRVRGGAANETCFALGPRELNFPFEMLVGCWSPSGSALVSYRDDGQQGVTALSLPATDVPYRIATFTSLSAGFEAQVILINGQAGGSAYPLPTGRGIKLGTIDGSGVLRTVDVPAPSGKFSFGYAVGIDCATASACDAYVLSVDYTPFAALPADVIADDKVMLYKSTFNPSARILSQPVLMSSRSVLLRRPDSCPLPNVAWGYGTLGVAVIGDAGAFKYVYTVGDTKWMDPTMPAVCQVASRTHVIGPAPVPDVVWGQGEIAGWVSWSALHHTALVFGVRSSLDGIGGEDVVWGTDRSLSRRMEWRRPGPPSGTLVTLSSNYKGFVIDAVPPGGGNLVLRWFDP